MMQKLVLQKTKLQERQRENNSIGQGGARAQHLVLRGAGLLKPSSSGAGLGCKS